VPSSIWGDILEGLVFIFNHHDDGGGYFKELNNHPENYLNLCTPEVIEWLKSLKKSKKILFLLTGSDMAYATFAASLTMGPEWKELFDIVISFAKKPGFFSSNRPFLSLKNQIESDPVENLTNLADKGFVSVSQGNWQELMEVIETAKLKFYIN
jgi:5' nucleotidase family